MTPAYAAASGHSAATATAHSAAVPRTSSGALVRSGGTLRSGGPFGHLIRPRATHSAQNQVSSENWSGYAASGSTFTSVSSSWVEPAGTCSSGNQYSSFWVGLDGYNSTSVEQTGSEVDCSGAKPQYYSWYEMYPAYPVNFSDTVLPGDHFTGSVTYTGNNSFTLTLADTTEGWSHTVTQTVSGAARSSAEVIAEAPCCTSSGGILPLADSGTVNFTGTTANGSAIGNFSPTAIDMVSAKGVQEDSVSSLTGGEDFTATWLNSGSPSKRGRHH
jgi:Peptidase A4 family